MVPKIIKTLFFALGLVMVWLGFFYSYQLGNEPKEKEAIGQAPSPPSRQLQTYTLSNETYSEKAVEELEFNNVGNEESTLIFRLKDLPEAEEVPERINTAGFTDEFDVYEEATVARSPAIGNFPFLLICGGFVMLAIGVFSFRLGQQKKQAF